MITGTKMCMRSTVIWTVWLLVRPALSVTVIVKV